MMRTQTSKSARALLRRIALGLLIPLLAVDGATFSGDSAIRENEAYRQAVQNAERELSEHEALGASDSGWSLSALLSIVALAAAIGITVWLARRLRHPGWPVKAGREMRIVDRLPLTRQSTLFIIQLGDQRYWLAEHTHGITLLGECRQEKEETEKAEPMPLPDNGK